MKDQTNATQDVATLIVGGTNVVFELPKEKDRKLTLTVNGKSTDVDIPDEESGDYRITLAGLRDELPIIRGVGSESYDVTALPPGRGVYSNTLAQVYLKQSSICQVDPENVMLYYRGHDVEKLVDDGKSANEVQYLLLHGKLPSEEELAKFQDLIAQGSVIPKHIETILKSLPTDGNTLDAMCTLLPQMKVGWKMPESKEDQYPMILGAVSVIAAMISRHFRGEELVPSKPELGYIANFLWLSDGVEASEDKLTYAELFAILHADHSMCASTLAALINAGTKAEIWNILTTAGGTLKGPLHGGANEGIAKDMSKWIADGTLSQEVIDWAADPNNPFRIMGIGHNVLKKGDRRYIILMKVLDKRGLKGPNIDFMRELVELTDSTEYFTKRGLKPNIDLATGTISPMLGVDVDSLVLWFFTFRCAGYCCHAFEVEKLFRAREVTPLIEE